MSRHRKHLNLRLWVQVVSFLGLVAAVWVEGELADELSGCLVDDSNVEVVDEQDDGLVGVCSSDADVVHAAGSAEADGAAFVDDVVANAVVGAGGCSGWGDFG